MTTTNKTARLAGLMYFVWILTGLYALIYVPSKLFVKGDTVATANNILANEFLFRTYILNGIFSSALWVFMVLVLYRLFKEVNERHAKLLVALVIVQVPIGFFLEAFNIASLMILKGEVLKTFELAQRQEIADLFLRFIDYGTLSLELYWGLWLFPLAMLVYKSPFLPRFIGVWLGINGAALCVLAFVSLMLPEHHDVVYKMAVPAMLGEVVFMLWLVVVGAKSKIRS